ncbi:LOW QUALITY PROTEIN: hypothetical protein HID58_067108 [Brassica napus]|uniref:Uncharacterized protein n=1 Tax=Brassica napus TaxID=3708 RepID=A0ABQ7ZHS7_BRANA|nr:LOW QUALITY PROTEIN: hypothetical protein HID58_067108 [Brassica napus]
MYIIILSRYGFDPARYRPPMHHLWLIRVAVSFEILRLRAPPLPLEFKDDNQSLALSYIGSSTQVLKLSSFLSWVNKSLILLLSRTVHVIEEGPREQRNQLFSVLGSLTDPEEEESKESSEVNSMSSLLFDVGVLCLSLFLSLMIFFGQVASILNYQEEEVCKWSSVSTHAEREELNGLTTVWLMNMALSLSSVVDVLSIISWSRILVIVEYDFRKETSKDSSDLVRRKLETLGCDSHQEEGSHKRVLPRSEMVMVLETCPGNLLELEEMEGLEELVLELGHGAGAGAGGRVIGVSARGGEAAGGEVAGGGDAGWGEAGASGGETVEAGTHGLCGGCGGGATGLITGATFGAAGGETVGVTAGGGVVRDAGGRVAETGGTTVVGGVA